MSVSSILLLVVGVFLLIDAIFLHALTFNYGVIGMVWLDDLINHLWIGMLFIIVGAYESSEG